ncbi:MAG TPA: CidA/LrgA family protein [Candidatus Caenarcaniphilales bacterium]
MIEGFTIFLVFQLLGEASAHGFGWPVPGPVIGLILLFAVLWLHRSPSTSLFEAAEALHRHLSLLFIPAGVGIMLYYPLLVREWVAIIASITVSTVVGLAVTAWVVNTLVEQQPQNSQN